MTYDGYFSQKIKIIKKPVRMVLEGLKYKILASETLTYAHDSTFAKDRHFSELCFTSKMCSFSVQNHKMCYEQRSVFTNVFLYDTCIQEISKQIDFL